MGTLESGEIGHQQQLIMQCVWEAGDVATVPQMIEGVERKSGRRLTRQAMNTQVLALVDKKYLMQGKKDGLAYQYHALISEKEFRAREVERFGKLTFGGSPSALVATMLESDISREELSRIRELLDRYDG